VSRRRKLPGRSGLAPAAESFSKSIVSLGWGDRLVTSPDKEVYVAWNNPQRPGCSAMNYYLLFAALEKIGEQRL
jgi:hypothetical protein